MFFCVGEEAATSHKTLHIVLGRIPRPHVVGGLVQGWESNVAGWGIPLTEDKIQMLKFL